MSISGIRTCIVTGAAAGIGQAIAAELVRSGYRAIIADIDVNAGRRCAAALGKNALFHPLDVTDERSWDLLISTVTELFGRLDVLVNNAGVTETGNIESLSIDSWRRVFAINVEGVVLGCKAAVKVMKGGGGTILNVASSSTGRILPDIDAYACSKVAVERLTKSVALHCCQSGYAIRCNSLHPGPVRTPLFERHIQLNVDPAAEEERHLQYVAMKRLGTPEEIAVMARFLISSESSYVTGSSVYVDGGHSIS